MQLHSFGDAQLLTSDLANQLSHILCHALKQRGQAYLVVSGGKTPVALFKALAKKDIPWDKITITLADERCVPMDDESRNEGLVKQFLLQDKASKANFLTLYEGEDKGLKDVSARIASLPTFDAVVLGMGEDGHTASLFPCAHELSSGLDENADPVLFVRPTTAEHQRVTLSKKRLLNARVIFFHLVGKNKLAVLHQAIAKPDPMLLPVSAFLNNYQANVQVMYAP